MFFRFPCDIIFETILYGGRKYGKLQNAFQRGQRLSFSPKRHTPMISAFHPKASVNTACFLQVKQSCFTTGKQNTAPERFTSAYPTLVPGKITAWGVEFKGADYPRILTHKVLWQPSAAYIKLKDYTDKWKIGVSAAAENLKIRKDGYLRLSAEIRLKHTGKIKNHTKDEPDKVYTIDFPQGSYNTKKFELEIDIPNDAANVNYIIEGENFEGCIVFETPFLTSSNGYNIIPSFCSPTLQYISVISTGWA